MASNVSLSELVHAITGALSTAQQEVERSQITNLGRFFSEDGRPRVMELRLPALFSGAREDEEVIYAVPLLTLAPQSQLRISEATFKFDVDLGQVDEVESVSSEHVSGLFKARIRRLGIGGTPSGFGRRRSAQVELKVEGVEHPEGLARLIEELNKLHGAITKDDARGNNAGRMSDRP